MAVFEKPQLIVARFFAELSRQAEMGLFNSLSFMTLGRSSTDFPG